MRTKLYPWLLPAALILFLIQAVLFPLVVGFTYAGRSESPGHVLTYTTGALTWDSATGVDPDTGAAELSLFSETDQNVQSDNGEKVVAPGTERTNIVRLKNNVSRTITYVAVMYRVKEEADLPVEPVLLDSAAFTDTDTYPLPDGVTEDQVVRAVTGTVAGGQLQDFDISWSWSYYENDQRDQVDTALGNRAAWQEADRVTAGLYIVVVGQCFVMQCVVVHFCSYCQVGWHKQTFFHAVNVLDTADCGQVFGCSISIGVLVCSIITVSVYVLCRGINT